MASYTASVYELMIAELENFNIKEIKHHSNQKLSL